MILIGTAGYSYDDWIGPVYPKGTKKGEMLEFYSKEFKFTEINSTYYAMPNKYMVWNLVQKTPEDFQFIVKAHHSMTHKRDAGKKEYEEFLTAINPLMEAGKMGGILAQFPFSYHFTKANVEYLKWFAGHFEGMPVAVEFRNQNWINDISFQILTNAGLSYVCVDEPDIRGLVEPLSRVTAEVGYVRFHGRNADKWYNHKESYERYNYLYSTEELGEWVPKIKEMELKAKKIFVSLNNHYQGQAVRNARMLREML